MFHSFVNAYLENQGNLEISEESFHSSCEIMYVITILHKSSFPWRKMHNIYYSN